MKKKEESCANAFALLLEFQIERRLKKANFTKEPTLH